MWAVLTVPMLREAAQSAHPILRCAAIMVAACSLTAAWILSLRSLRHGQQRPAPAALGLLALGGTATVVVFTPLHLAAGQLLFFLPIACALTLPWQPATLIAVVIAGAACFCDAGSGLALGVLGSSVGCMLGRMAILRNEENRILQKRTQELELTNERNRMARDLHDILGHSLTAITLKSELSGKLIDAAPSAARAHITEIENISRTALAEVRATINNYRKISLATELAQAASILQAAGIRAEFPSSIDEVPPELREIFAWVLREGSTNIARHSHTTRAWVTLSPTEIRLEDNGTGPGHYRGNGLRGLDDRCRALSITLSFEPRPGGGSILTATSEGGNND